jgi:hypothetical protein
VNHKVAEIDGALLDAAVAKAEGVTGGLHDISPEGAPIWLWDGLLYSREWAHGGPIIERERLELRPDANGGWYAMGAGYGEGHTLLIAAMRAYADSKFGEEVDLP